MANVGGPRSSRRRLLMSAVQSVLLYSSEVWADALNKEAYRLRLARVQRQAAVRVASAYRTVSEPAVLVIAGVIPVKLLAAERKAIYQRQGYIGKDAARTEERSRTFRCGKKAGKGRLEDVGLPDSSDRSNRGWNGGTVRLTITSHSSCQVTAIFSRTCN
ncbi:uncharacterized protein LOC128998818 [Macrosteles quadrilineatus]|uniref:uncharacterized protein LOC128998818 n=1 Tax=Macrosteles quadrilineatus TaxID=74068 RepID=UPI0023E2A98B|nr:uncharacterized protein LOC128998818 [Macrosteles quadrilineatus]